MIFPQKKSLQATRRIELPAPKQIKKKNRGNDGRNRFFPSEVIAGTLYHFKSL